MARLVVSAVSSAAHVRRALLPGEASEFGAFDGEILDVADEAEAARLVEQYPNVEWASADAYDEDDSDSDSDDSDETADDLVCGVNGCSRTVDEPGAACWQHSDTDGDDSEDAEDADADENEGDADENEEGADA